VVEHPAFPDGVTPEGLVEWYRSARERSRQLFEIPAENAYYERPISLRNPIVFYEGHLPAFSVNTLLKLALRERGIHEAYEKLFERGIDPEDEKAVGNAGSLWPLREDVQRYASAADERIIDALSTLRGNGSPLAAEARLGILEHEQMHHETFAYMLHNLDYAKKKGYAVEKLRGYEVASDKVATSQPRNHATQDFVSIPAGIATLGADRRSFGWDNEFPAHRVHVPAFSIQRHNVTNGEYLEFVEATGAPAPHFWQRDGSQWCYRGMFELRPLPLDAPVYVTHEDADSYARWKGAWLPTEAQYHRAAFGTPEGDERDYPWGDEPPDATRGNFDFANWDPVPVGSYPNGASAWGVHDLVGNGWEWTSTVFAGFDGFEPMPTYRVYSAEFFDGRHYVMKGASPVTARHLVRRSFRNWFRPNYPYVYATFRCAV
jgi:formylglycine-generating enzyme required for sulfatase activity